MSGGFSVTLWGTRGSLATPGPSTMRYGGNTSCVHVESEDGTHLVLDAGTGIRPLGLAFPRNTRRVDILLTHLHMDHIQGLGFFRPVRTPGVEVHVYAPASTTQPLRSRLSRYLSPPLFPIVLRDFECDLNLHQMPASDFQIGPFTISSALVCHPDPTVGYRVSTSSASLAYLPDHEPALGYGEIGPDPDWVSGCALARGADLLIHDAQYSDEEYVGRVGWGHSSVKQAMSYAALNHVKQLVPFHHDPSRTDAELDNLIESAKAEFKPSFLVHPGREGQIFLLGD